MKRFLGLLLFLVFLLPLGAIPAQAPSQTNSDARKKCCHGCGSYACNRQNCGDKCKEGPGCRGCWKSCDESNIAVNLTPASLKLTEPVVALQADQGNPNVKVWVNTASGVYHCPGTRWYGTTKHGEYMTQADAQKKGYRPAYGKACE